MKTIFFGVMFAVISLPANAEVNTSRFTTEALLASDTKTIIVVDQSDLRLDLVQNRKSIYTTQVMMGKNSTPTLLGTFKIYSKERNRRLKGVGYNVPVSYWMPFSGGYGLHDASWRQSWEFGNSNWRSQHGSHGCINLPAAAASKIWYLTKVGTPVFVQK
jgi:lipoprotein-anchoring transpeptidase ErfK/SrfK